MKYSRTALGLLNAQYRSVLRKCFLINAGLFALGAIATATPANADEGYNLTDGQSVVWILISSSQTPLIRRVQVVKLQF